ncbi:MAG: helix-turn-helix transcriptional regulator, partial [Clostridia bacterium]|nr:helix-turn-helix transcriptional regulator [Clostridia bacterium]
MNIETANRLYQYRKSNNLSQEELAERIGVSRQAVSKWERAEASPDTDNLIMLAKIYGVTLDELLNGKGEEQEEEKKSAPCNEDVDGEDDYDDDDD